jgi:hypothetical protein
MGQHCGIHGTSILDVVATVRDVIAYAEHMKKKLCLLTLDFRAAFDRLSHTYLYQALRAHGISEECITKIRTLYNDATTSVQINGHVSGSFPILSSVRQGYTLSMQLYAICRNPLLHMIDRNLKGIRLDPKKPKTSIVAYADDVTILITDPSEVPLVQDALKCYQEASGALINFAKSTALAVGGWNKTTDMMGIAYHDTIKILGIHFHSQTDKTADINWSRITRSIRAQASETYNRNLCMDKRIKYIHSHLMAKAWYVAQVLPLPQIHERQLRTTANYFVWHGVFFKVPTSTLQRTKREGGWDLVNIATKSRALYHYRICEQGRKTGTITAGWLKRWGLNERSPNPPQ